MGEQYIEVQSVPLRGRATSIEQIAAQLRAQAPAAGAVAAAVHPLGPVLPDLPVDAALMQLMSAFDAGWRAALTELSGRTDEVAQAMRRAADGYDAADALPPVAR